MPLILVSNDANATDQFDWKDVTGVHYHYPNGYRNMIQSGEPFIYYRGVRRADGSRGQAEYFGHGMIGEVWRDGDITEDTPKRSWAWYCSIEDYEQFNPAVPARIDGVFFEDIPFNQWRNGVRRLNEDTYLRILDVAGIEDRSPSEAISPSTNFPPIDEVMIPSGTSHLMLPPNRRFGASKPSTGGKNRFSRTAKLTGDRAEAIALRWIKSNVDGARDIRWVAQEGLTPGWDIEFRGKSGELVAVEVKGTSGGAFTSFELTSNELSASKRMGCCYLLILVADCLGTTPRVQTIQNPAEQLESGGLVLEPIRWSVAAGSTNES